MSSLAKTAVPLAIDLQNQCQSVPPLVVGAIFFLLAVIGLGVLKHRFSLKRDIPNRLTVTKTLLLVFIWLSVGFIFAGAFGVDLTVVALQCTNRIAIEPELTIEIGQTLLGLQWAAFGCYLLSPSRLRLSCIPTRRAGRT